MAQGDISLKQFATTLKLIEGLTAANGAPSGAPNATPTAGTPGAGVKARFDWFERANLAIRDSSIVIANTAGSGAVAVTARLWLWHDVSALWFPAGKGVAANKGTLNDGAAIDSASAVLRHVEPLVGLTHFDGIYIELLTLAGTTPAFDAYLVVPHEIG